MIGPLWASVASSVKWVCYNIFIGCWLFIHWLLNISPSLGSSSLISFWGLTIHIRGT